MELIYSRFIATPAFIGYVFYLVILAAEKLSFRDGRSQDCLPALRAACIITEFSPTECRQLRPSMTQMMPRTLPPVL